ncbi:MAG: D-alanyl-D-alanine carboxypeptidase [Clostridia bacterium]|nr:D-alanyl-D-alanine carboxypeptidase [Clostridia bacterium]
MKRIGCLLVLCLFTCSLFPLSTRGELVCSAKGAVVMEATSEWVLYERNAHKRLPQASTTKIMTALLVLESVPLTQSITVSAGAAGVEGSQLGLKEGDRLTVSDLLYALMLKSGNDAAEALAEGVAGSVSAFVERMNRKAEALGLADTHFQNPHGLPDDDHYTTAHDLAKLTAAALEDPTFCNIVSTQTTKLTYKNMIISNSNKLLESCEGVFGVKTGFTKKAGRCLVSVAERNGVRLICVTLNDPNDWQDHAALYDTCFPRVEQVEIVPAKGYRTPVPVLGGCGVAVENSLPIFVVSVDGDPLPHTVIPKTVPRIFAPIDRGRTLGYLEAVSPTGRTFSTSPLNTVSKVEEQKEERTAIRSFLLKLRKFWRALIS